LRLLLDTHTLVWWITSDQRLPSRTRTIIGTDDNDVLVSIASAWEIAIKVGLGKWPEAERLLAEFEAAVAGEGFDLLPISVGHARGSGLMPSLHLDPFDRLLAAQAQIEGLTLVTADARFARLGATIMW
jgi:PIN domain nuclease of toxin-antitoxin system